MRTFLLVLLLVVPSAWAEDVVTYTGTTYEGCVNLGDTTVWLTDPNDYATVKPGYLYVPTGCASVLPGVPERYRKISGGVVVEMSQAEKDAIDAPAVAAAALQASYDTEISSNDLCDATLDELVTRINAERDTIQTAIDGTTNIASARTAMTSMNTRYAAAFRKVAKCLKARLR